MRTCYGLAFYSGIVVLLSGNILPELTWELGLNYAQAGSLLSVLALGYMLANFFFWIHNSRWGSFFGAAMGPACLLGISITSSYPALLVLFTLLGLSRGVNCLFYNNYAIRHRGNDASALNLVHMAVAAGAFVSPFLMAGIIRLGGNWRGYTWAACAMGAAASVFVWLCADGNPSAGAKEGQGTGEGLIPKSPRFYRIALVLFLYVGLENCVSGWFVTYLQDIDVMDGAYAAMLLSVTWLMIMLGRLGASGLSRRLSGEQLMKLDCAAAGLFFLLLVSTRNLAVITVALSGLGLAMASIYPTCISLGGKEIHGCASGIAILQGIGALGGLIAPEAVGVLSDRTGNITSGILLLGVNAAGMILLAFCQRRTKTAAPEGRGSERI